MYFMVVIPILFALTSGRKGLHHSCEAMESFPSTSAQVLVPLESAAVESTSLIGTATNTITINSVNTNLSSPTKINSINSINTDPLGTKTFSSSNTTFPKTTIMKSPTTDLPSTPGIMNSVNTGLQTATMTNLSNSSANIILSQQQLTTSTAEVAEIEIKISNLIGIATIDLSALDAPAILSTLETSISQPPESFSDASSNATRYSKTYYSTASQNCTVTPLVLANGTASPLFSNSTANTNYSTPRLTALPSSVTVYNGAVMISESAVTLRVLSFMIFELFMVEFLSPSTLIP